MGNVRPLGLRPVISRKKSQSRLLVAGAKPKAARQRQRYRKGEGGPGDLLPPPVPYRHPVPTQSAFRRSGSLHDTTQHTTAQSGSHHPAPGSQPVMGAADVPTSVWSVLRHRCRASHSGSIFLLRFHSRPRFHRNRVLQLMDVVLQWAADHYLRLRWRSLQVGATHSRSAHRLRMVLQPLFRHHAPSCRGGLPILGHLPVNIYHPHPKRLAPSAPSGTTALPAFRLRPGPTLSQQAMSRPPFNRRPNARARLSHGGVKALSTHPRARGRGSWPSKPCHPRR